MQRLVAFSALACPARAFVAVTGRAPASMASTGVRGTPWTNHPCRYPSTTARFLSSSSSTEITHIGLEQMQEIIEDYEEGGREESQYCVIDVRTEQEVAATGKVGEHVYTLPVQVMQQYKVLQMEPDEFLEFCKFEKPSLDETLVFTCAAGIRSVYACQFAAQAGYTKIINYTGGANEWFSPSNTRA
jgi:rhodanese-related sulfurtransferase